jgi:hypothetical protein
MRIAGVLALLVCTSAAVGAQRPQQTPALDVLTVHGQVYLVAGPSSNAIVQVGDQGVLKSESAWEMSHDRASRFLADCTGL